MAKSKGQLKVELEAYKAAAKNTEAKIKEMEKEERRKRQEEEREKVRAFRNNLEASYGVQDHPKANKVWELAWEHGHANGFSEIEHYYHEFVSLII